MEEYDDLSVYKVNQTPNVREIEGFKKFFRRKSKEEEKRRRKEKRSSFKEEFLKRFRLDSDKFSVNLIKRDGKWMVEVCHKNRKRCVYQDYETVCSILDRECKLPDNLVGYNVNLKV